MPISTIWADESDNNTDWLGYNIINRHTYGAAVGTVVRIVYGNHVRYGGTANMDLVSTTWVTSSGNVSIWT